VKILSCSVIPFFLCFTPYRVWLLGAHKAKSKGKVIPVRFPLYETSGKYYILVARAIVKSRGISVRHPHHHVQTISGAQLASYPMGTGCFNPVCKAAEA